LTVKAEDLAKDRRALEQSIEKRLRDRLSSH